MSDFIKNTFGFTLLFLFLALPAVVQLWPQTKHKVQVVIPQGPLPVSRNLASIEPDSRSHCEQRKKWVQRCQAPSKDCSLQQEVTYWHCKGSGSQ
jgi:hypothetical protein